MRVVSVIGTRPEAIKMAPVVKALEKRSKAGIETFLIATGQHDDLIRPVFDFFCMKPDFDLGLMQKCGSLNSLLSAAIAEMDRILSEVRPDIVLVHGDTTSAAAAAVAAFHQQIKVGHVEAGLRTGNLGQPWPEEWNRRLISLGSKIHFAPTQAARARLIAEGISADRIHMTGNTVVDALLTTAGRLDRDQSLRTSLDGRFAFLNEARDIILITSHRRENFGQGIDRICRALLALSERQGVAIVFPVHPNPQLRNPVVKQLSGRHNIHLIPPADYAEFVYLMKRCNVILTDSGGVQEEAPSFGKPVLLMRNQTERDEAVAAGLAELVGTDPDRIVMAVAKVLDERKVGNRRKRPTNPFGDGRAAERIAKAIIADHGCSTKPAIRDHNARIRSGNWSSRANRVPLHAFARRGNGLEITA